MLGNGHVVGGQLGNRQLGDGQLGNRQLGDGSEPAIAFESATKHYGRQVGIDGLTLTVAVGEIVGLLGPNGAGKTTALRMLLGLLHPTSGRALIEGEDVTTAGPRLRACVGYLPGTLELYGNLTGRRLLDYFARLRRQDCGAQARILADRLDLDLSRHVHDLSRGNKQKLGVVQAFMHQPRILVLDEPTSGLDPLVQREFEELLREHRAAGGSVLLSSHVLSEVEHLADRVAILEGGCLLALQTVDALRSRALRSLELDFPQPIDAKAFTDIPGVMSATANANILTCEVIGEETELIRRSVELGVRSIRSHEPTLEEAFLALVNGGDPNAAHHREQVLA